MGGEEGAGRVGVRRERSRNNASVCVYMMIQRRRVVTHGQSMTYVRHGVCLMWCGVVLSGLTHQQTRGGGAGRGEGGDNDTLYQE